MSEDPAEYQPVIRRRRRWSSIWVVPAVALGLASWLVWKNYADKGPLATVRFENAEGIEAGKTEVRCLSVRIGVVEAVALAKDLASVDIKLRLDPKDADLLVEDASFWVVRARLSASSVSGLSTLVSGAYIELQPGTSSSPRDRFIGLEEPPVTSSNVPGLRLTLNTTEAGSLNVGSPIYYRGFAVGNVERRTLDVATRQIRFDVFIEDEFAPLVRTGTRFWNTSGIDVSAGADGFKLHTPSLQAMITGGASFAVPKGQASGEPAADGASYALFDDEAAARDSLFDADRRALLFFDQSIRGLAKDAPVEYRGIPLGRVIDISLKYSSPNDSRIPVLIELDTKTLRNATDDPRDGTALLTDAVRRGLRARLGTGSLLTGALFVDLDFVADAAPAELGRIDELDVIPTQSSGLAQMEAKLNAILSKIQALPLDETLAKFGNAADETADTIADARKTLAELDSTLAAARKFIASDATQAIPEDLNATLESLRVSIDSLGPAGSVQGDLRRTLDEMRAALRSFQTLSDTIEEKPNSLLFGRESSGNPIPRARPVR